MITLRVVRWSSIPMKWSPCAEGDVANVVVVVVDDVPNAVGMGCLQCGGGDVINVVGVGMTQFDDHKISTIMHSGSCSSAILLLPSTSFWWTTQFERCTYAHNLYQVYRQVGTIYHCSKLWLGKAAVSVSHWCGSLGGPTF